MPLVTHLGKRFCFNPFSTALQTWQQNTCSWNIIILGIRKGLKSVSNSRFFGKVHLSSSEDPHRINIEVRPNRSKRLPRPTKPRRSPASPHPDSPRKITSSTSLRGGNADTTASRSPTPPSTPMNHPPISPIETLSLLFPPTLTLRYVSPPRTPPHQSSFLH